MARSIYSEPARGIAGQKYGLQNVVETCVAGEDVEPGAPVFGAVGDGRVFNAHRNVAVLTADGDCAAGNTLAVTVNGVELSVGFDTDAGKTLEAVADAINGSEELAAAGIGASADKARRTVTVAGDGVDVSAGIAVTGGSSRPSFTCRSSCGMRFVGVAARAELSHAGGAGFYPKGSAVNVLTRGKIWAPVADGANPADKADAFVALSGGGKGAFTDAGGDESYDCGCAFRSDGQDGLALVEVRGLK